MAKGATDWIARTDVLLQTLSELIVRYKYGATQIYNVSGVFSGVGWHTLIDVSAKGILLGGFINDRTNYNDYIRVTLDGVAITSRSFIELNNWNIVSPVGINFLMQLDTVNTYFNMGIRGDITFDSSFKLEIYLTNSLSAIDAQFLYATI